MAEVQVENHIFEEMEQVRRVGATNMLDYHGVLATAEMYGLDGLITHLYKIGRRGYGTFLMVEFNNWRKEQLQ